MLNHLCRGLPMGTLACVVCERVCACKNVCLCVIASVGLAAARFTVELVGVDNNIRKETDLEAE